MAMEVISEIKKRSSSQTENVTDNNDTILKKTLKNSSSSPLQRNLSLLAKFYIFALHGYFIEVNFTAICNFLETRDFKLAGNSSLWSLLIYGSCGIVLEELCYYFQKASVAIPIRAISYLFLIYLWEFSTGLFLTYFNACPWDYSHYQYNIKGLITLEYAPFWAISGLLGEYILLGHLAQLKWIHPMT